MFYIKKFCCHHEESRKRSESLVFGNSSMLRLKLQISFLSTIFHSSVAVAAARRSRWWNQHCSPTWPPYRRTPVDNLWTSPPRPVRRPEHRRESADSARSCWIPAIRRTPVCWGKKTRRDAAASVNFYRTRPRNSSLENSQIRCMSKDKKKRKR